MQLRDYPLTLEGTEFYSSKNCISLLNYQIKFDFALDKIIIYNKIFTKQWDKDIESSNWSKQEIKWPT